MAESAPLLASYQSKDEFPSILQGKKVLLATESWGPVNGVSRTTRSLVEYLRDHGVDLILVAPQFKGDLSAQTQSWERRLPGCALPYNPDLTVVYPFHIGDVYRQTFKPDVIYLASPASLGFQMLSEIMLPAPLDRYGVWLLALVQGFLFCSRAVHTIFYPCSAIRGYLENAGAPVDRMVQLGRGVDTVLFTPEQRDETYRREIAPNGEIILICVCRIAPEKGFEFLAQVATRLAADKVPFKLLIVGGNRNPVVENKVKQLFNEVRNNVIFTGFLTGAALARAYASADLFLHCSITETFGLVVLEAMASGIPVIARDQGGPSDIIRNGQTGYLVSPHDLDKFTQLTRDVSQNTSLRLDLAKAARQYADETTDQESQTHDHPPRVHPGILASVTEQILLVLAVGVVYAMWLIAVVPLIVHGHRFVPRAWQAFRNRVRCVRARRK